MLLISSQEFTIGTIADNHLIYLKQSNERTQQNNCAETRIPVRILQFGEGNFLRAFVDWMINKANDEGIMNHGIAVVQPIPEGETIKRLFEEQDCMYHVYLEGIKNKQAVKEVSLVRCIDSIVNPYCYL